MSASERSSRQKRAIHAHNAVPHSLATSDPTTAYPRGADINYGRFTPLADSDFDLEYDHDDDSAPAAKRSRKGRGRGAKDRRAEKRRQQFRPDYSLPNELYADSYGYKNLRPSRQSPVPMPRRRSVTPHQRLDSSIDPRTRDRCPGAPRQQHPPLLSHEPPPVDPDQGRTWNDQPCAGFVALPGSAFSGVFSSSSSSSSQPTQKTTKPVKSAMKQPTVPRVSGRSLPFDQPAETEQVSQGDDIDEIGRRELAKPTDSHKRQRDAHSPSRSRSRSRSVSCCNHDDNDDASQNDNNEEEPYVNTDEEDIHDSTDTNEKQEQQAEKPTDSPPYEPQTPPDAPPYTPTQPGYDSLQDSTPFKPSSPNPESIKSPSEFVKPSQEQPSQAPEEKPAHQEAQDFQ